MNAVVSVCLLACALGIIVYLLSRRETTRRSQYGPAGLSEFRTGLALDELLPAAREYGEAHTSIYGVVAGMALMAVSLLLLEARRGGRPGLTLLPELLEYETDGTEREALRAARHAKGDCP